MASKRAHVTISGRVQGVNFRYYTLQQAIGLGVEGWVRNLPDGRVEAVFEGDEAAVDQILAWCQMGPRSARVDEVQTLWEAYSGEYGAFRIR